jgi:hypothetical protein
MRWWKPLKGGSPVFAVKENPAGMVEGGQDCCDLAK